MEFNGHNILGGLMLQRIFELLTIALANGWIVAFAAAFIWGIASIILSACHLASIPLIVGFIDGRGQMTTRRAFVISLLFSVGILISIAMVALVTALLGRMLGDVGPFGIYFVVAIFFLVGLNMIGVIPMPFSAPKASRIKSKGLLAAFMLGLIFGIALGPCSFAYMAPILGILAQSSASQLPYVVTLLCFYGLGHCGVIVLAGTFTEVVQRYLNWNEKSKGTMIIKRICGILVIAGGLYLIYIAP